MGLHREDGSAGFSADDAKIPARVAPHVAYGLRRQDAGALAVPARGGAEVRQVPARWSRPSGDDQASDAVVGEGYELGHGTTAVGDGHVLPGRGLRHDSRGVLLEGTNPYRLHVLQSSTSAVALH